MSETSVAVEPRTTTRLSAATAPATENLFLPCACGWEAVCRIETPFGSCGYCSRHLSFLENWPWLEYVRLCEQRGLEP